VGTLVPDIGLVLEFQEILEVALERPDGIVPTIAGVAPQEVPLRGLREEILPKVPPEVSNCIQ
jgi:hypothetical protein